MKKINVLMLGVLVLFAGFFASCNKDSSAPGPSITFDNGATSGTATSGSYTINGTAKAPGKLDKIQFYTVTTSNGSTTESEISGTAITSFTNDTVQHFSLTVNSITATTTIKVLVTDKNSVTASSTFTINVGDKLNFWTGTLAAQLGASSSSVGSSYATSTNIVYTASNASANCASIDLYYFYSTDASVAAEIMSPYYAGGTGGISSVAGWTTKNATKFGTTTLTAANFDAIVSTDDSQVISAATSLTADRVVTLAVGNVFAFQTAAGKKGLAKVTALTTGLSGTITIEVKVQK